MHINITHARISMAFQHAETVLELRLVIKHRMISTSKTCFSLKIYILIHNWTSKNICSIRYTQYVYILFWTSRKWLYKRRTKRPKKSAAFGGRLLVLCWALKYNHFLGVQNKIYPYWVYLLEHIFFEVQLCIQKSIFNEFCGILGIWQIGCRVASHR